MRNLQRFDQTSNVFGYLYLRTFDQKLRYWFVNNSLFFIQGMSTKLQFGMDLLSTSEYILLYMHFPLY